MYDILKIPISRKLFPLDPAFVAVTTESHLTGQIFDTLVVYNDVTEKNGTTHCAYVGIK